MPRERRLRADPARRFDVTLSCMTVDGKRPALAVHVVVIEVVGRIWKRVLADHRHRASTLVSRLLRRQHAPSLLAQLRRVPPRFHPHHYVGLARYSLVAALVGDDGYAEHGYRLRVQARVQRLLGTMSPQRESGGRVLLVTHAALGVDAHLPRLRVDVLPVQVSVRADKAGHVEAVDDGCRLRSELRLIDRDNPEPGEKPANVGSRPPVSL